MNREERIIDIACAGFKFVVGGILLAMIVPMAWAQVAPHKDAKPTDFDPPVTVSAGFAVGEIVRHKGSGHRGQILELNWVTDYTKRPNTERVASFRVRFWSLPPHVPSFDTIMMLPFELEADKK